MTPGATVEDLDALYLGDFDGFVARRNDLAKRLRADGDADGADRVRALGKPGRVAWSVNQLGHDEPALSSELLDAGKALRDTQKKLVSGKADGAALKQARAAERAVVARAIEATERLVDADGATLSAAAAERVRQTLHAVALDEDVRRDFEAHRLEADRDASGLTEIPAGAGSRPKPAKKPTKADKGEAQRERAALKQARAEARQAERTEVDAEKAVDAAHRAVAEAQRQLDVATDALEKAAAEAASTRQRADDLGAAAG